MGTIWIHDPNTNEPQEVGKEIDLPVAVKSLPIITNPLWAIASIIRPDNITQYAVREMFNSDVGGPIIFDGMGDFGTITGALLASNEAPAVKAQSELWLFRQPPTMAADNAVIAFTDADFENWVATIQFGVTYTALVGLASGNCGYFGEFQEGRPIDYTCAVPGRLWGASVVANTYTPVSREKWTFILRGSKDS
jgi:hypothetical protein